MRKLPLFLAICVGLGFTTGKPTWSAEEPDITKAEEVESETSEEAEAEYIDPLARKTQIAVKPEGELQPWRLLRSIQRAQDEIVNGERDAIKAYRILLLQSANWMKDLDSSTWQYQKNLDSVATYLLMGGDVELGYKALQESRLERPYKILLEAAVAYAERDVRTANMLFQSVDHTLLPPSISGQVALAKSMMFSSSDILVAQEYLDQARKLSPGTLVEEAAIRRAVRVAAELKNKEYLARLLRTYLFRFPKSYYFNDFLRNASYALLNFLEEGDSGTMQEFQYLFERITPSQQIAVAEYSMRRAVISGNHDFVLWLAEQVLPKADEASKAHTRLEFYYLAAKITDNSQIGEVVAELETLPVERLSERDRDIFEVVFATGQSILLNEDFRQPDMDEDMEDNEGPEKEKQETATKTKDPLMQQVGRLNDQLSSIEKLVEGSNE